MYVFALVSPDAFQPHCFEQPGYQSQVALFFRGLEGNSLLLVDEDARLIDEIDDLVGSLPIKFRQELVIRLTELRKHLRSKRSRQWGVRCSSEVCRTANTQSTLQLCKMICAATSPDAFLVSDEIYQKLDSGACRFKLVRMAEYLQSKFEKRRHSFMESLRPLDQMDPGEFDDLIVRCTKFSVWLRFFDKQIGKGTNLSNFRRGIEHIVKLWIHNAHFPANEIEIITAEPERICETDSEFARTRKREKIQDCLQKIRREIAEPLQSAYGVKVHVGMKRDAASILHARHLQSQTAYVLFERGFDFENDDGTLRRSFIKVDNGAEQHLAECRRLPDTCP
jgi:hypothetical protein